MAATSDWKNDPLVVVQDAIWPVSFFAARMLAFLPNPPKDIPGFLTHFDRAAAMLQAEGAQRMIAFGVAITEKDQQRFDQAADTVMKCRQMFEALCQAPEDTGLGEKARDMLYDEMQPTLYETMNHFRMLFITLVQQRAADSREQSRSALSGLDRISKQIYFISINASIEAARAGEAGRGFSQISTDIRELSQSAQHATQALSDIVGGKGQTI